VEVLENNQYNEKRKQQLYLSVYVPDVTMKNVRTKKWVEFTCMWWGLDVTRLFIHTYVNTAYGTSNIMKLPLCKGQNF
jgi:hypothetical protein